MIFFLFETGFHQVFQDGFDFYPPTSPSCCSVFLPCCWDVRLLGCWATDMLLGEAKCRSDRLQFCLVVGSQSAAEMSLREGRTQSRMGVSAHVLQGDNRWGLGPVLWFSNSCVPRYCWELQGVGNWSLKYRGARREDLYRKLGAALYDEPPPHSHTHT